MGLPRLELPPGALVLFESVPEGLDRSGGFRFAVTQDGRFLHSGNRGLEVEPGEADDDDSARFWTGALEEITRFGDEAMAGIRSALHDVNQLPETTRRPPGRESNPTLERITTTTGGTPQSVVAYQRARPGAVKKLLEAVERAGQDQG